MNDSAALTVRYGRALRYTANPPGRRRGEDTWDAGAVEDWCEVPTTFAPRVLADVIDAALEELSGAGRIARQQAVHRVTPCVRAAPHWRDATAVAA